MLTVNYSDDEAFLRQVFARIGEENVDFSGINAVLFENEEAIGLAKLFMNGTTVELKYLKVADDKANEIGVVDFFFRTILYKLSLSPVTVFIATDDNRLTQFGFKKVDGGMSVEADEIEFPSSCGGH